MRVRFAAVLLAVVLSGCIGGLGPQTNQSATGASGADGVQTEYPAGVNETGLHNATALVDAHGSALADRAYVAELWVNGSTQYANGTLENTRHWVGRADGDGRVRTTYNQTGGLSEDKLRGRWTNGTLSLTRHVTDSAFQEADTWYRRSDGETGTSDGRVARNLQAYLAVGNYTTRSIERRDGGTRLILAADGLDRSGESDSGRIEEYDGRVVVDETGRIVSANVSFVTNQTDFDGTIRSTASYESRRVGGDVAVDRPPWFDRAVDRAPRITVDLSVVDGRYVEVTNTGEDPIPGGTFYQLLQDGSGSGDAYGSQLSPGESVYLFIPHENGPATVSSSPPEDAVALSGEYTVAVDPGEGPEFASGTVTVEDSE